MTARTARPVPCPRGHRRAAVLAAALAALALPAQALTPTELLAAYTAQAGGAAPSAERGEKLYNTTGGDLGWNCASCHTANPAQRGRHALTEKRLAPLAPAANASRFTDRARVDGWFRNNCRDIFKRDCSAAEKADILAWLLTVKP